MNRHLILLHTAQPGPARNALLRHWQEVRAPWAAQLPGVRRYVQDVVLAASDGRSDWFGAEEFWVDDAGSALALQRRLAAQAKADAASALPSPSGSIAVWTTDHVVVAGASIARDEQLPKRMTFLRRKAGMRREATLEYWRHSHGPLAGSVPGVRRYVQSPASLAADDVQWLPPEPPIDGVAQIWIDDEMALLAIVTSPLFRERVKPDEANFVDTANTFTLSVREQIR